MTALDRVLLAADLLEPDALGGDEAHAHLDKECPWYAAVAKGEGAHDPGAHCKSKTVELTPRTPEASTVPEPTVPPGGPGLFHIKGRELPPYVQHLWHHLAPKYGKQKAYGMAVGIVKKWAAGIHPGGKKGKGGKEGHVHPDVRAAAAKNVAQWEKDKADAHAQSREHAKGHVKATVALAAGPSRTKAEAHYRESGSQDRRCGTCSMFRDGSCTLVAGSIDPAHVCDYWEKKATVALAGLGTGGEGAGDAPPAFPGNALINLPPVPRTSVTKAMFTAHRLDDTITHLAHAHERLDQAKASKAMRAYHMIHVGNHLTSALDGMHNLVASVRRNYLPEARELEALSKTMGLAKSVTTDAKVATFAHLLQTLLYHLAHAKRHALLMLDPDPEAVWKFNYDHASVHLAGAQEHAHKLAKHVLDNYPDEARWLNRLGDEEYPYGSVQLAAVAPAGVQLAGPVATAPGAKPVQAPGLYQRPSQTVSPSPPLPPKVTLPTAAEIRALISQVPECADATLSASARTHLETVAVKLGKDDPIGALHVLRSAQSDIYACHKSDLGAALPAVMTANVFARIVPAEQSSANAAMIRSKDRELVWRRLEQAVAVAIDKIRRRQFHGLFNGQVQEGRFAAGSGAESPLGKVVRLSG